MKRYDLDTLTPSAIDKLLVRQGFVTPEIFARAETIVRCVADEGDRALIELTEEFDGVRLKRLRLGPDEIDGAPGLPDSLLKAMATAADHIERFHRAQQPEALKVNTADGVSCGREWKPIRRVGLYVPGGAAPLLSTALMLGIPARLAGCTDIVLCTPPDREGNVSPGILAAAKLSGITTIFAVGGAQAIAAMAVGTATIPKVDKIFGPGNRYVTAAKQVVFMPPYNTAIDMTAGPSEILILADGSADPRWIASDLIAQAEHGEDSRALLVTTSKQLAVKVEEEIAARLQGLPRKAIAENVLAKSPLIIAPSMEAAVAFSERFAPEHLLLAVADAARIARSISNAGSVFIGQRSSVVFGDYASGTNHTLPTAGAARAAGGITVESFMKPVLFQTIGPEALGALVPAVAALARAEGLEAHARAAEARRDP